MVGRLSSTIFQGDSDKAVLVEDAYKISKTETRNTMYDSVKGIYADAVDGLYANKRSPKQLASIIMAAKKGTINRSEMIERALGAMGSSLPALLGQIGGTLKNKIGDVAGTLIGPNAKKNLEVVFNNIPLLLSTTNVKDTEGLFEVIAEITGNSDLAKMIDVEAESAIIAAIASSLMTYGIPELVDYVIEESRSEQVRWNAWQYISIDAVYGADLAGINKVIDMIGLVAFLERNPDAINQILSSFFFGTADTVNTYPAKRTELLATLNRINPRWMLYDRNGKDVPNLEPFQVASANARTLFWLESPEREYCLAAENFPKRSVSSVILELYPEAFVSES